MGGIWWLLTFLVTVLRLNYFRARHFRPAHFASGHWTGPTIVIVHRNLSEINLTGPSNQTHVLNGPSTAPVILRGA